MNLDKKYILIVLILAILIILLYNMLTPQMTKKLMAEYFVNTTYPSVPCTKIKLSSTDNNIYLFGILFYDDSGTLINPNTSEITFDSSSVYNKSPTTGYYPGIAAKGIYNFITNNNNISRNLSSLQNTTVQYNSDNAIDINFTYASALPVKLPSGFGTWNINSPISGWVSATADSYTNGIGNSYWSITFPTQLNLSAIEIIGYASVNVTMKVEITDSTNNTKFSQILPKTSSQDYYRQIVIPITPTTTQAPTTTPFITTPYNTQYLNTIINQLDNGYSMINNNRFTIMDNQLKLDSLNARSNKLLNNINKLNNISNQNKTQTNDLTFY